MSDHEMFSALQSAAKAWRCWDRTEPSKGTEARMIDGAAWEILYAIKAGKIPGIVYVADLNALRSERDDARRRERLALSQAQESQERYKESSVMMDEAMDILAEAADMMDCQDPEWDAVRRKYNALLAKAGK